MAKTSCNACGSSDARELYDDHSYCFSCGDWQPVEGGEPVSPKVSDPFVEFHRLEYVDLANRRLTEKSCRKYHYGIATQGGQAIQVANYYDDSGRLVAQKCRTADKRFWVEGDIAKAGLFGEQLWEAGGKRLVITEGELDAISYAQVTGLNWPAVSVPGGAQAAPEWVKRRLEFIESFEEVFFMYDDDEPGRSAANECAALLTPGKARIITLPLKDASDMLQAGRNEELRNSIFQAKTFRPDGIFDGTDITLDSLLHEIPPGYMTPYTGINAAMRGIRQRELIMLCAGSGIGKTTLARELGYHLSVVHGAKTGWIMLEESMTKSAQGLIAIDNNIPLGELMLDPSMLRQDQWAKSKERAVDSSVFYDAWGSTEIDNLISKVRYMAVGCDCKFVILDHISMVVSGLAVDNERKAIDMLMTHLRKVIEQTNVGVIAIVHLKRSNTKDSFNEGASISLTDLRGSAAIEQLSDHVIALERDQQAEEDSNVATVRFLKNRQFGVVGKAGYVQYNKDTGRLENLEDFDRMPDTPASSGPPKEEITF